MRATVCNLTCWSDGKGRRREQARRPRHERVGAAHASPLRWLGVSAMLVLAIGCATADVRILNDGGAESDTPAGDVPGQVRRIANQLVAEYVDGKQVDYAGLRESDEYRDFRALTKQLRTFDLRTLDSEAKKIAFWVNLYNALVMDAVLQGGVKGSVREQEAFFDRYAYQISGHIFTPNDIEHGILRRQRLHPTDPRQRFVVRRLDPRIHFALNCASVGCPPVAAYDWENLEAQLDAATRLFVNAETRFDAETQTLHLSKIFEWYRDDFGYEPDAVPKFLLKYLNDSAAREYLAAHTESPNVVYDDYDWSLNR